MSAQDLGPLDWRVAIVDSGGRPTPEFQRRWNTQRGNNDLIGATLGSGAPPVSPTPSDSQQYIDISTTPFTLYTASGGTWHQTGVVSFTDLKDVPHSYTGASGKLVAVSGSGLVFRLLTSADIPLLTIGFILNSGAIGTNVGPELIAPRAGSFTQCKVVTKTSDATTDLTFKIKQNGTDIFTSDPTVVHNTAAGTVNTFTAFTSSPLSVAANDLFTIDVTSGTASWQVTVQLE